MIRADELARIQQAVGAWLGPQTATVTRPDPGTQTTDGFPGSPLTIATGVACRVEPASTRGGGEQFTAAGVASTADWNIYLPWDIAEVKPQDKIQVPGIGVFEVTSSTSQRAIQTDVVASCTKVDS
ncbi:MAG: hypothetical protein JWL76_2134 [Thermoleophilia bacterium]|nr:hypothetical protein [Thermoleophilia bacterium]